MSDIEIAVIAAVADNGVIGHLGRMPWRLKGDLKHFRRITMGRPVIMGRKTFESIGKPLDGRPNIVVSRNLALEHDDVQVAYNLVEAVRLAEIEARKAGVNEICVIGGGEIYAEMIQRANRLCITHVHGEPEGDTHFPEVSGDIWQEAGREEMQREDGDSHDATFVTYERRC
ncbi:MAG TPA: dihydrofolate reductase, partial [Afifellaceae bacterium]|nr:dihydrofolate reductase [Afifellaceae bacterium]